MEAGRIIVVVRVRRAVAAVVLAAAGACGDEGADRAAAPSRTSASESSTSSTSSTLDVEQGVDDARPPDVVIHAGDRALTISAHSFCYADLCADGTLPPPSGPPDVGASADLFVEFPLGSWSFEARVVEAGTEHGGEQTIMLEPQPDGRWRLPPAGVADTYDIWLLGRGEGGDAGYVFRWTSTEDGT